MVNIKNVSPMSELDVPLLGRHVKRGEVVEVSPEHAERLLLQGDVWRLVANVPPAPNTKNVGKADLLAHAALLGIVVPDGATKADIATLINEQLDAAEDTVPILQGDHAGDGDEGEDNDSIDAGSDASETKGE